MKFELSVPAGYESPYLGSPYTFSVDSTICIVINDVRELDVGSGTLFVNYDLSVDTDRKIAFNRTDCFNSNGSDDMHTEAKLFLTGLYTGNPK
ncbi:hypothetical protein [Pluralibacter gergoviae]|uniref:hypothetical protein n=1 Tax=Pluralibacter gergoviae TaxID=61647 RepID=UPI0012D4939B|nr:hypothetical protein [Pluralibacter gergoviae]